MADCSNCEHTNKDITEMPCKVCQRAYTDHWEKRKEQLKPAQYKTVINQLEDIKPTHNLSKPELAMWESCYNIVKSGCKNE